MTDHANLTKLKEDSCPKVLRWMTAIQEFRYELSHIKGSDNVVADALSRLCVVRSGGRIRKPKVIQEMALGGGLSNPLPTANITLTNPNVCPSTFVESIDGTPPPNQSLSEGGAGDLFTCHSG